MPCGDGCYPITVYVHADDCGCKNCRASKKEDKRQNELRKKLRPKYIKAFGDGVKKIGLPVLGAIHQEKDRWEQKIDYKPCGPQEATDKFGKWLDHCDPFPENLTFKFLELFGCVAIATFHEHVR